MLRASIASRLAWRDLRASRRQSGLILVLVALPVLVATVFSTVFMSAIPTPAQQVATLMGSYPAVVQPLMGADGTCTQVGLEDSSCMSESESPTEEFTPTPLSNVVRGAASYEASSTREVAVGEITLPASVMTTRLPNPALAGRWLVQGPPPGPTGIWATDDFLLKVGAKVGDQATVDGRAYTIVGAVEIRTGSREWSLTKPSLVVPPGHPLASAEAQKAYLNEVPDEATVAEWNRAGWAVLSREQVEQALWSTNYGVASGWLIVAAQLVLFLVVGSIVAAAFTANLQRRQRSLALLRATGASSRTLRGTVLWQGAILGGLGALLGVGLGLLLGAAVVAVAVEQRWLGVISLNITWWQVLSFATTAVLVTLAVTWWAARGVLAADPLAALRTSRAPSAPLRRPWIALALLALGVALALAAGAVVEPGRSSTLPAALLLAIGSGVALWIAALAGAGWLLQQLARLSRPSLAWRLALRDATRNRARTLATTAATASGTSLALLPLLLLGLANVELVQSYRPSTPPNVLMGQLSSGLDPQGLAATGVAARRLADQVLAEPSTAYQAGLAWGEDESFWLVSPCGEGCQGAATQLVVGGPDYLRFVLGRVDSAAEQALADGSVVVFDQRQLGPEGTSEVNQPGGNGETRTTVLRTHLAGPVPLMLAAISPQTAERLGAGSQTQILYLRYGKPATVAQLDRLNRILSQARVDAYFSADTGPRGVGEEWLLLTAAIGIAVGLAVAVVGAGIAIRDGHANRSLLASLGALDRIQRKVVGVQALFCVGLGALIGGLAILVPVIAVSAGLGAAAALLPWWHMAAVCFVPVPVVAAMAVLLTKPTVARVVRLD